MFSFDGYGTHSNCSLRHSKMSFGPLTEGRELLVVSVVWFGPDPTGYNGAAENVLSVDGRAACSSRKECGDRGHVC